ncbi:hypothetical protein BK784_08850 [Bacillus thuringiensis serovar medellin]|uniref:Uncharacterized protein n=1 Tax=Bacillus thuringiensis subsp. medellin TaxID=79672 RepID=A0A9X6RHZ9_BACTV|nr:hypothetical protein [Bacillus thuringiensis]OUC02594.1 hypothetical protein BK784_08850 [Bacillus thuringiensis serovar medellin]
MERAKETSKLLKETYVSFQSIPSKKSMKNMRECIKAYTKLRNKMYLQLEVMVKGLYRILQGFKNYYYPISN